MTRKTEPVTAEDAPTTQEGENDVCPACEGSGGFLGGPKEAGDCMACGGSGTHELEERNEWLRGRAKNADASADRAEKRVSALQADRGALVAVVRAAIASMKAAGWSHWATIARARGATKDQIARVRAILEEGND